MEEECDADPRVAFAKGRKKFGGQPDERSTAKARQINNPFEKIERPTMKENNKYPCLNTMEKKQLFADLAAIPHKDMNGLLNLALKNFDETNDSAKEITIATLIVVILMKCVSLIDEQKFNSLYEAIVACFGNPDFVAIKEVQEDFIATYRKANEEAKKAPVGATQPQHP